MDAYRVVSSVLMPIEALSAFARRYAVGDLTDRDFAAVVSRLDGDRPGGDSVAVYHGRRQAAGRCGAGAARGDLGRRLEAVSGAGLARAISWGGSEGGREPPSEF